MRRLVAAALALVAPALLCLTTSPASADDGDGGDDGATSISIGIGSGARHCPASWTPLGEADLTARSGEDVGRLLFFARPNGDSWCGETRLHRGYRGDDTHARWTLKVSDDGGSSGGSGGATGRSTASTLEVDPSAESGSRLRFVVRFRTDDGLKGSAKVRATTP